MGKNMIEENMKNWQLHLKGEFPGGLDELLADDCTFFSPIVFSGLLMHFMWGVELRSG